ncbi:hypothetical protein ACLK13_09130 [Escherichia coli]
MPPGQSAAILRNGVVIGHIGVIHPSLEKKLGLKSRAVMFELELEQTHRDEGAGCCRSIQVPGQPSRHRRGG